MCVVASVYGCELISIAGILDVASLISCVGMRQQVEWQSFVVQSISELSGSMFGDCHGLIFDHPFQPYLLM